MLAPIKNLAINKGNTKKFKLQLLNQDNNIIVLEENVMIYFTVKEDAYATEYIFQKTMGNGIYFSERENVYIVEIDTNDTDLLTYKDYFYDIAIVRNIGPGNADKKEKTTVLIGDFTVELAATFKVNEII